MKAAGLRIPEDFIHQLPGGGPAAGAPRVETFMALPERPTAYVCYNDMLAIGVLKGLQSAGIQVPEQASVTGFDNIIFSAYTNPPLTTFDQPKRFIGAEASRLMLDLLNDSDAGKHPGQSNVRILKGRLLVRKSTAAFHP